jgi:hypothetical protein
MHFVIMGNLKEEVQLVCLEVSFLMLHFVKLDALLSMGALSGIGLLTTAGQSFSVLMNLFHVAG